MTTGLLGLTGFRKVLPPSDTKAAPTCKWSTFSPLRWSSFTPPLTHLGIARAIAVDSNRLGFHVTCSPFDPACLLYPVVSSGS
jgi:hypothetical protein